MRIIGEAQQRWALLKRNYDIFSYRPSTLDISPNNLPTTESKASAISNDTNTPIESAMVQFASISAPFLSWDFTLRNQDENIIGSVNRSFGGFAREIFTDTGAYALRMDSAALMEGATEQPGGESALTLDQRAVMLATAVSIDFDYFSRHSSVGGGGFMPLWFPGMGGSAEAGAGTGAAGAGAEAGGVAVGEGAGGVVGGAARGAGAAGMGEGAIAGAGTMAGYEAMQRGRQGYGQQNDDGSPVANDPYGAPGQAQQGQGQVDNQDTWGEDADPWGGRGGGGGGDSGGGDGGDGGGFDIGDWL